MAAGIFRRYKAVLTVLTAVLALAACSGGDGENAAGRDTTAATPAGEDAAATLPWTPAESDGGRWRLARDRTPEPQLTDAQQREIDRLRSLGYVAGSQPAPTGQSAVWHDAGRAWPGLNLCVSGHGPEVLLMDMDGAVLHRWLISNRVLWAGENLTPEQRDMDYFRRARLLPGGDLLVISEGVGIAKLDRHSRVIWVQFNGAHHDLEIQPDGDILVLTRRGRLIPHVHPTRPVLEDFIVLLGPDGREKQRVSILESFENSADYGWIWQQAGKRFGDAFHSNSVEMLDGRSLDRAPAFAAGRVLISIRQLNTVAVVDLDAAGVVWAKQGPFTTQHEATILDDGSLMLFNNLRQENVSAVEVYDPATGEEIRHFAGTEQYPFFTRALGTNQPLPNGNVLITESNNGRAFEIDPDHRIVWEFNSPHRAGDRNRYVATLFEMQRLPADLDISWAEGAP